MSKPAIELSEREFAVARVELVDAWKRLEAVRDRFLASVRGDAALPAWCQGKHGDLAARTAAIATFADFFYVGEESARSVHRLIGLIGSSPATIRLARKFNDEKQSFAQSMSRLQSCVWIDERQERHPLVRTAFQQIKIARINTLQATRQIVIVERGLQKIRWCISTKTRIKQVTREEAIKYIRANPNRRLRLSADLAKLERLPAETLLARYRPGNKCAIANATYLNQWGKPENRQFHSGIPLLIELTPRGGLPECRAPNPAPVKRRPRPTRIEARYFVKSLKLRRYRSEPIQKRPRPREQPLSQIFRGP
jgi:hypothetical protein